jgi:prefoldin subunit 5
MSTVQTQFIMNFQTNQLNEICESLFDIEQNIKTLTDLRSSVRETAVELLLMVKKENLPHRYNRLVLSLVATDTWQYRDAAVTRAQKKVDKIEEQLKVAKAELKAAQSVAQKNKKAQVVNTTHSCRMSGAK